MFSLWLLVISVNMTNICANFIPVVTQCSLHRFQLIECDGYFKPSVCMYGYFNLQGSFMNTSYFFIKNRRLPSLGKEPGRTHRYNW